MEHPITSPPGLVEQWRDEALNSYPDDENPCPCDIDDARDEHIATQAAPVPVAVSERPWERDGWCDEQGQCWMGDPGGGGFIPSWRLCRPEDAPRMKVSLPAHALPLPREVQP